MSAALLNPDEQKVVLECMKAVLNGRLIDDFEFQTRLGIYPEDLEAVIAEWPVVDGSSENNAFLAINNCLNEISYGLRLTDEYLVGRVGATRVEVVRIYEKWRQLRGDNRTGIE